MFRQGDVLFVPAKAVPDGAKKLDTKTVAYGEATGHHHTLVGEADIYQTLEGQLFAHVGNGVQVTHQEHENFVIAPGVYEVRIQREYTPERVRNVAD